MKVGNSYGYLMLKGDRISDAIVEGATSKIFIPLVGDYGFSLNVMNFSFELRKEHIEAVKSAIRFAYKNNVVLVASSGNDGDKSINYPASYNDEWALKVGASGADGEKTSFSNYGHALDLVAPGVPQLITVVDPFSNDKYTKNRTKGTSSAAPHVAGTAGLMLSYINAPSNAPNNLAPEDVENLMQKYASKIGGVDYSDENGFGRLNAGATLQGIRWPRFEVKHYSQKFDNSSAAPIASNTQIDLLEGYNGIAAGVYWADIYEVEQNFDITQPSGRTIIDVWKRNSSSTLVANENPLIPETNCIVSSWNSTSAKMKGYIYLIRTNMFGQTLNKWIPNHGLAGQGIMALTVYSEDPLANSIETLPIDNKLVRIVPNPSNGKFTLMFTRLKKISLQVFNRI